MIPRCWQASPTVGWAAGCPLRFGPRSTRRALLAEPGVTPGSQVECVRDHPPAGLLLALRLQLMCCSFHRRMFHRGNHNAAWGTAGHPARQVNRLGRSRDDHVIEFLFNAKQHAGVSVQQVCSIGLRLKAGWVGPCCCANDCIDNTLRGGDGWPSR